MASDGVRDVYTIIKILQGPTGAVGYCMGVFLTFDEATIEANIDVGHDRLVWSYCRDNDTWGADDFIITKHELELPLA